MSIQSIYCVDVPERNESQRGGCVAWVYKAAVIKRTREWSIGGIKAIENSQKSRFK